MTFKKSLSVVVAILFFLILYLWYWGLNPASELKTSNITEVGVYSLMFPSKTLWDIGFNPGDCIAPEGDFSPEQNCIFIGKANDQIAEALHSNGRSYYFLGEPEWDHALYTLVIHLEDGSGFSLIIGDLHEMEKGKFTGKKYTNDQIYKEDKMRFIYHNPQLGKALKELMSNE
ncbi:hypothetical protein J2S74_003195 [Evansella vedderi]|uniref:Uncharacterized protein n=1 Tax=Evansella vedderi TaxID=38282 RepID=A0ABT9ZX51_9BACI|nr:hypothetical protein [Evansella vedderi]MDQ0255813.1 hypothetical protein [Evansella vedderi]